MGSFAWFLCICLGICLVLPRFYPDTKSFEWNSITCAGWHQRAASGGSGGSGSAGRASPQKRRRLLSCTESRCYAAHNKINPNKINDLQCLLTRLTCFANLETVNEAGGSRGRQTFIGNIKMSKSITSKRINDTTARYIKDWAKADVKSEAAKAKTESAQTQMVDDLRATGVKPDMLKGAGKGKENTPLYTSIIAALVTTLPAARQRAITGNIDTMTKAQKVYRRQSMQQVGSKMSKIQKALEKSLAPRQQRATGGATNQTTTASASAPAANNTSATPLKSYIEKVSTGYDIVKSIPPTKCGPDKTKELKKLIGDLVEALNSIK